MVSLNGMIVIDGGFGGGGGGYNLLDRGGGGGYTGEGVWGNFNNTIAGGWWLS